MRAIPYFSITTRTSAEKHEWRNRPVPDVHEALKKAFMDHRGKTDAQTEQHLEELKENERLVMEVY